MSGVSVIGELLNASSALTAVVPAARIKAGSLPQDVTLPALAVTTVSGVDRNILMPGATRMVRERVQVTVLANSYRQKNDVLKLVRSACADKRGDFAGQTSVVVLTESTGPDFMTDDASIWMISQDFAVSYNETT